MHKRTLIIATITIVIVFLEILFLQEYNKTNVTDYSSSTNHLSVAKLSKRSNNINSKKKDTTIPLSYPGEDLIPDTTLQNIQDQFISNDFSNSNIQDIPTPLSNNIDKKPDYELDFSKIPDGTAVSSYFRVQNGIDDNWDPSWNNEKQMYAPGNVTIKNGNLVIQAKVESNGTISSGKVDTYGFFQAAYGTFEVVARLPAGIGTFPAIWMLPSDGSYFHDHIATASEQNNDLSWQGGGEIDNIEFLGVEPNSVFHDVHTYTTLITDNDDNSKETIVSTPSSQFHTYGVVWTPSSIAFTVDGVQTNIVKKTSSDFRDWPFDKPFYLILNLAMGGDWNDDLLSSIHKSYPNGINNADKANWVFYIKSIKHFPL